jgi:O-6-methylguanine DNA methyltransferase
MIEVYIKEFDGVWFGVACEDQQVFTTAFANDEQEARKCLLTSIPYNRPFQIFSVNSAFAEETLSHIKDIYDGKENKKNVSLSMDRLPNYTQKVLKTVAMIPVGYVTSYGAVAKAIGGSARAVGNAMASNPFAPIVPCHRVISSDFTLGGYGGGLVAKHEFLKREGRGHIEQREILVNKSKLKLFPTELVLKKTGKIAN